MAQLSELARKFPEALIKQKPGKFAASYVEHGVIVQRLLEVVGPFTFTVDETIANADGTVVGCLATLEVEVDGRRVHITEVGDVEHPGTNNGSNLKNASSDALKRCAMRLGLGLHLWTGDAYYLDRSLAKAENADG
ncbi:MAG TPA: Rad52/Rad22 family DNA repair protein [Acidimicrobiia bacterium]